MATFRKGDKVTVDWRRKTAQRTLLPTSPTAPTSKVSTLLKLVPYIESAFLLANQVRMLHSVYNSKQSFIPVISTAIASASSGNFPLRASKFRAIPTVVAPPAGSSVKVAKMPDARKKTVRKSARSNGKEDDDVIYMYSVDASSTGRIVEEVDLSNESENTSSSHVQQPSVSSGPKSRKRKREGTNYGSWKRPNTRSTTQPRCTVCKTHYGTLAARKESLCRAKCGHLFCLRCTKGPQGKKMCGVCNQKIDSLCKLYI